MTIVNFMRYQIIQRLVYQNSPVLMLAWRGSILWLTNRYGPISYGPTLYGPYHMVLYHMICIMWYISMYAYHLDHIVWTIYLFVSLHFLMLYLCIAITGCLYITSQWLLLWYSESLLGSENVSDLKVASKRRPCRKIEE